MYTKFILHIYIYINLTRNTEASGVTRSTDPDTYKHIYEYIYICIHIYTYCTYMYTQRNLFSVLFNHTKIRLYLAFIDIFELKLFLFGPISIGKW